MVEYTIHYRKKVISMKRIKNVLISLMAFVAIAVLAGCGETSTTDWE